MAAMAKLRIMELREAKGWSQTKLAEEAGIARSYLSEIESGKKPANTHRLEAISRALDVSVQDLFSDDQVIPDLAEFIEDFCALPPEFRERMRAEAREIRAMLQQAHGRKR